MAEIVPPRDELRRILQISPQLRLEQYSEPDAVLLLGEREHYIVRGTAAAVLAQVDGERDVEQIVDACINVPAEWVLDLLARLEQRGLLAEVRVGKPEHLAFAAGLPAIYGERCVELVDASTRAGGAMPIMAEALRGAGFELVKGGLQVIVADDYLASSCEDWAISALRTGRAVFLVRPLGLRPMIGPYFTGASGQPCPRCLTHALDEQRPVERLVERIKPTCGRPSPPTAAMPASVATAANLAAIELRRLAGYREPPTRLWTLDFPSFELVEHRVRQRPQCPTCGDPTLQAKIGERPVTLELATIGFSADGGLRRESPAESLAQLSHLVSPVLGPVTHLSPMQGRHSGSHPVFSSGYLVVPRSATGGNAFNRNCAGKGCTLDQARMSALAEAIERSSGVYRGDEALLQANLDELGDKAIHPDQLQLFSEAQRARGLAPPRLAPQTQIAWTPAWSLTNERRRWVPLAYCYTEAPDECGASYCRPSSNGSAAGLGLEEAILQGLFEVIERDAVAIWWYGRVRRPALSMSASVLYYFEGRRADYAALGWSIWPLDLTHDLGVPVVVVVAVHEPTDRLALGFGAHSDSALALRRAVSELDQVFDPQGSLASPWDGMAASRLVHLWPDPQAPATAPAAAIISNNLKEHVTTWVRRLDEHRLETIVVEKTRPDFGLRVAQVIVPGLRHPWPRFAPGRLYTVPVALGWSARPLVEDELHSAALLI